jgi:hypothetical protein
MFNPGMIWHMHAFKQWATKVSVCGLLQADSLAALSKDKLGVTNTTLLAECVKMRRAVYKKMAINGLRSAPTKQATYK